MKRKTKHTCPTCRKLTHKDGHLCVPHVGREKKCSWCGSLILTERHICNKKIRDISYVCNSCGRTAVSADNVCKPQKIK